MQNGFVESLTGRFRDECLNEHLFRSLPAARRLIEDWRIDYNMHRPHTSLGGLAPFRYVRLTLSRTIRDIALMIDWECAGCEASPSAGVLDSQTVEAPAAGADRAFDKAKTVGRKRHVAIDTDVRVERGAGALARNVLRSPETLIPSAYIATGGGGRSGRTNWWMFPCCTDMVQEKVDPSVSGSVGRAS